VSRPIPRAARLLAAGLLTAATAVATRWLRVALETRPNAHEPGPAAANVPAAARDEQRLADTTLWRAVERRVAMHALQPFRARPPLHRLRILNLDHGPGGIAAALAALLPQDATLVASDATAGMAALARHRLRRRVPHRRPHFVQTWSHVLPFQDDTFDLVVSSGGMHQWPNPHAALVEIERVLAQGGRYYVLDLRRDLNLALWLLVRFVQAVLTPRDLRAIDEPSSSVAAAYVKHEAEWLAARAKLRDFSIRLGPAWLIVEPSHNGT
jgi:ubiquinone/menaquinone biosynthesis C-methylase UbiE